MTKTRGRDLNSGICALSSKLRSRPLLSRWHKLARWLWWSNMQHKEPLGRSLGEWRSGCCQHSSGAVSGTTQHAVRIPWVKPLDIKGGTQKEPCFPLLLSAPVKMVCLVSLPFFFGGGVSFHVLPLYTGLPQCFAAPQRPLVDLGSKASVCICVILCVVQGQSQTSQNPSFLSLFHTHTQNPRVSAVADVLAQAWDKGQNSPATWGLFGSHQTRFRVVSDPTIIWAG